MDFDLSQIYEWKKYENKLIDDPTSLLPSLFIKDELETHDWNNIPIPLINALETIKKSIKNTENIIIQLGLECRKKNEVIVNKFKEVEKKQKEGQQAIFTKIDFSSKNNRDIIEKNKVEVFKRAE